MKKAKNVGDLGGGGDEEVTLRRKDSAPPPSSFTPSPYNFMRRSCTFVAESSFGLRKSSSRTPLNSQPSVLRPASKTTSAPAANKVVKDRKNLAMQVRQKKELLEESVDGKQTRLNSSANVGSGRMSRLVGGLRAWSSTEDVRQSFMGALGRTVSVIKQKPVSKRVKQALAGKPDAEKSETITSNGTKVTPGARVGLAKTSTNRTDPNRLESNKTTRLYNAKNDLANKNQHKTTSDKSSVKTSRSERKTGIASGRPKSSPLSSSPQVADINNSSSSGWFRHIQEAQEAYTARDGRNRRAHTQTPLPDPDDQPTSSSDALRDGDDGGDIDGADAADGSNDASSLDSKSKGQEQLTKCDESSSTSTPTAGQPSSPADSLSKKTEHLRRKDLKIRQALEEKQRIIADILNIPHEHFENVVDMAGEPTVGNKEPKELVLAALFQAKCLQETLNEALNIGEGDIIAARASNDGANKTASLPLYQAPMTKLMSISTSLHHQLTSLLNLISERDDERERMRKELVASKEQLRLLHMRQNSNTATSTATTSTGASQPIATSPHTSRPSSFVSVASSTADHSDTPDHHDTDEESRSEMPKVNSLHPRDCEDSKEEVVPETFEDAVSGGEQTEGTSRESEGSATGQACNEGVQSREAEGSDEVTTT